MDALHAEPMGRKVSAASDRRGVMRTLAGLSAATFALLEPHQAPAAVKGKNAGRHPISVSRRKKCKKCGSSPAGPAVSIVLGVIDTFDVRDGESFGGKSACPPGSKALSASLTIGNPVCGLVDSVITTEGDAWVLTVGCPVGASSANNAVQAICLG